MIFRPFYFIASSIEIWTIHRKRIYSHSNMCGLSKSFYGREEIYDNFRGIPMLYFYIGSAKKAQCCTSRKYLQCAIPRLNERSQILIAELSLNLD